MKRSQAIGAGIDVAILLGLAWCLGWMVYTVSRWAGWA